MSPYDPGRMRRHASAELDGYSIKGQRALIRIRSLVLDVERITAETRTTIKGSRKLLADTAALLEEYKPSKL